MHVTKNKLPNQISSATNLVLDFSLMLSSFVAVVTTGKSSQVKIAAGLSDPEVTAIRCSVVFSCPDNSKVVYWGVRQQVSSANSTRALQFISTASANRSAFSSILYMSAHRISIACNAKLKYWFLTCRCVRFWAQNTKKGHHAVEWGVKMTIK